jgi:GH15 family glucan-1,4-alpha-glucosidase
LYDENEGAFIAAPEFDPGYELSGGYGYCWPRDAVICALAVQKLNRPEIARHFFEWTQRTQLPSGHWYQRYWSDGSHAPSWCVLKGEIQLDQTCAILHAAGLFARRLAKDDRQVFLEQYLPTAERATRAILDMIGDDGLHLPARDLWENAIGAFAYTQAGVIAALCEAEEVFGIEPAETGSEVRLRLRDRLLEAFYEPDRKRWIRCITPEGHRDATMDSSAMGLIEPWGILDLTDAADRTLALDTLEGISQDLRSEVKGGGAILRFQGESYMGGGPGCVNTLWLAYCRLRLSQTATGRAERIEQRRLALEDIRIALANTSPTGQIPEIVPKIMFEYWAAPHAWASSLLIESVLALRDLDGDGTQAFAAERARIVRRAPSG